MTSEHNPTLIDRSQIAQLLPDLLSCSYLDVVQNEKTEVIAAPSLTQSLVKAAAQQADQAANFIIDFFQNHQVKFIAAPYRIWLCRNSSQVREAALANGRQRIPVGINSTIVKNQLVKILEPQVKYTQEIQETAAALDTHGISTNHLLNPVQVAAYQLDMAAHEYIHILDSVNCWIKKGEEPVLPKWFFEGFAFYVGGQIRGYDYLNQAQEFTNPLPPISLELINYYGASGLYNFGHIRLQRVNRHPAVISAASFMQFLIQEAQVPVNTIWQLHMQANDIPHFYQLFAELTGLNLSRLEENWLEAIGQPSKASWNGKFQMDVINFDQQGQVSKTPTSFNFLEI